MQYLCPSSLYEKRLYFSKGGNSIFRGDELCNIKSPLFCEHRVVDLINFCRFQNQNRLRKSICTLVTIKLNGMNRLRRKKALIDCINDVVKSRDKNRVRS